jgi:magnesium transporter
VRLRRGYFNRRYSPPGAEPGTLVPHAVPAAGPPRLTLIDYDEHAFEERECDSIAEAMYYFSRPTVTWLHVHGGAEVAQVRHIGRVLGLHSLALEDVVNTGQRPKAERYEDEYFVILGVPCWDGGLMLVEQVSLFLGENYVLSFHQGRNDPFGPVRDRLRSHTGRFRARGGADYLFYTLVDIIVDQGVPTLEMVGEHVESLETELLQAPTRGTIGRIHALKRELLLLRRFLWPQREVVYTLTRDEHPLIGQDTRLFLRDCYDHAVQVLDMIETYREMAASMLDVYLSSLNYRLNDVMRLLTVIATVFIPLTFITGIYGMNFDRSASPWNMPELGWRYGYPAFWGLIALVAGGLLLYFKRKDWL